MLAGILCHSLEAESEPNAVEQGDVGADRIPGLELSFDLDVHLRERQSFLPSEHLQQLDTASRDPRKEELGRRHFLAGAAVVDRAVDDEVMLTTVTQDSTERIGGAGIDRIAAHFDGCHELASSPALSVAPAMTLSG
jgi:hypothetical protein